MYTESVVNANVSSRQRWIIGLMCASIVLSIIVIGVDASINLEMSWRLSPGPAGLCIIHHASILILSYKERKSPPNLRGALPAMAKLGGIICIWLLFVLWTLVLGFAAYDFHGYTRAHSTPDRWTYTYPAVFAFIIVEYVVAAAITILMTVERLALRRNSNPSAIPSTTQNSGPMFSQIICNMNHRRSRRQRWILWLMYSSTFLSILILAADGSTIFAMSMFSSAGAVALSIAHHATIFVLS